MNILRKMIGKSFKFMSIGIVVFLIMAIITVPVSAMTPTGPFNLEYYAGDNGYINGTTPQLVEYGGSGIAVEAVPHDGYHFVQWNDDSIENPRTDTDVTYDVVVTASFAKNIYYLNYYESDGGTLSGVTSQTVEFDVDGTPVTAIPNEGYRFAGWDDGSMDNPRIEYGVYGDIDVTAYFEIDTFMLEYVAGADGWLSGDAWQEVDYGADGTAVEAVPYEGYHFTGWSDDSTENPRTDTNITENIAVTAYFSLNSYTLVYTAGANGSLTGDTTQTVDHEWDGTAVTAVPDTGYLFVDWSDGSTDNPRTDTYVADNINVTANFAFLYTVTFDSQGGSAVPDQFVIAGGKVDYPDAPTKTGLYFAGWYKEATCDTIWHSRMDLISGNTTLYAKWNETAPKVAIFYGDDMVTDVQTKLVSTGLFSQVDLIPIYGATPNVDVMKQYHAILLYSNTYTFQDPVGWGNVLADYVDAGGGVVLAPFTLVVPGPTSHMAIDGRISTDGYLPFNQGPQSGGYHLTLVADVDSDPILNGVNTFDGGDSSFLCTVSLTTDASLIAHWSNDIPLVATKQLTAGRVVGLNFFPPSVDAGQSYYWLPSTDGALLMANSLVWAASTGETISAPTITSDGGGDTASFYVEENQTAVTQVTATDPDSTTFTYSISGGVDASKFAMDASTGELTFKVAPDFESPTDYGYNNTYDVTVQVSDGGLVDSQEISVTVTNAPNEAPVISSNGGEATAFVDVKEGETAVTTVYATDPDNTALTYSISGIDADLFTMDSTSGELTFKTAPDFETKVDDNKDGVYEVTVIVSDGFFTDTQAISVTVTILTPVDLLDILKADINILQAEGKISKSTASSFIRSIDKAIAKINAGDPAGASNLLNSLKTTINRQIPRKITSSDASDLVAQIDLVILRLNS